MKVLMFGWEFPPHISGGLGTACFGLTQALTKLGTRILFVVPKAENPATKGGLKIISATDIDLPVASIFQTRPPARQRGSLIRTYRKALPVMETVSVNSPLLPYTSAELLSDTSALALWNYKFQKPNVRLVNRKIAPKRIRYPFPGSYGPNLLEDVAAYQLVGAEIARQSKFDVIHAHDWLTFKAGIAAKKISGKPLVVHVHATEFDRAGANVDERVFKIERDGMQVADCVVAVSQWTKNIIVSRYLIPSDKVRVIHNGALPATQHAIPPPAMGKPTVTFLGRVTYQKGPEYFVDAAHLVHQKFPDVHFVMAGAGDLLPRMIERAAHRRISSHFHFTGFLDSEKVNRLWAGSAIYVMPSVSEPFGISPLEAAQSGIPVIISRQSGVAEVMQHVVKVDFWNVEALADAICNILKYRSLSSTLRQKCKYEISRVTWERAARKLKSVYHEIAKKN